MAAVSKHIQVSAAPGRQWYSLAAAIGLAIPVVALAQAPQYPTRPIRMIVPLAAGGTTDIVARLVGQRLNEAFGQAVVVDNRPGGGTTIAAALAARAAPDGYTLLFHSVSIATTVPLYPNLPYDPLKAFAAISPVAQSFYVVAVHPSVPVNSVKELIALAKSKPKQVTLAHAGTGTITHLTVENFMAQAGIQLLLVPYKGGAPALAALVSGQVQTIFNPIAEILPQVRAGGKVRTLAVTSPERAPELPDVPTLAELGYPGATVTTRNGLYAPAGTPRAIITKLNGEINRMVNSPEAKERFRSLGLVARGGTPEELDEYVRSEVARWTKVVKEAGIKIN
ncbi:MAG: tripartite tricarboxylate transporter substrate binding protein [Betaproteobacteria bacterium]|nr:MAG: tripartite tricarboxylate transporter substrate binding protein [Betaproteobacteria bacterium]